MSIEKEFDTVPVSKLVLKLGVPAMFAQFVSILYSIVDRIFIGNILEDGSLALAGIGVCAPIVSAISGFASMAGLGGSSLMSICIGRKDRKTAQYAMNNAMLILIVISVVVTIICLALKKPLLYLLGCSENTFYYADSYFTIYILGTFAALIGLGMNNFIIAQGMAKIGMISMVMGAVVNIALDPVFIYVLSMGTAGAALATVISQICVMIYVMAVLLSKNTEIKIQIGGYNTSTIGKILKIGIMPFQVMFLENILVMLFNVQLKKYGGAEYGDIFIACNAAAQSAMQISACPAMGVTTGCGTLFGYYYGASDYKKIMKAFKSVFFLCLVSIGFFAVIAEISPQTFAGLFFKGDDLALASQVTAIEMLGVIFLSVQFAFVDGVTSMGLIRYSMPLSLFRKAVYVVGIYVIPLYFPAIDIFYAHPISDALGAIFTAVIFFIFIRPILRRLTSNQKLYNDDIKQT